MVTIKLGNSSFCYESPRWAQEELRRFEYQPAVHLKVKVGSKRLLLPAYSGKSHMSFGPGLSYDSTAVERVVVRDGSTQVTWIDDTIDLDSALQRRYRIFVIPNLSGVDKETREFRYKSQFQLEMAYISKADYIVFATPQSKLSMHYDLGVNFMISQCIPFKLVNDTLILMCHCRPRFQEIEDEISIL